MSLWRRLRRIVLGEPGPTEVGIGPGPDPPDAADDPDFQSARAARPVTPKGKGSLDASAYAPIARPEILAATEGSTRFASPWFGRRDLIPPDDDPRTNLIDWRW